MASKSDNRDTLPSDRSSGTVDEAVAPRDSGAVTAHDLPYSETLQSPSLNSATDAGSSEQSGRRYAAGDVLGNYVVLQEIGVGGMGIVYAGYDPKLDRRVAIKVMRPEISDLDDPESSALMAEAKAMARLSDPNVCTVFEVGTIEDSVFIVMEFIDGETLDQWLKREPRTWRQVVQVMVCAGHGLMGAHRADIVHRDFKPANIMIDRTGRVRVMDFGVAYSAAAELKATDREIFDATRSIEAELPDLFTETHGSSLVGTIGYIAPEQLAGAVAGACSDQFAYCATLYKALYGTKPFPARTLGELRELFADEKPLEPPAEADVPRWLSQAVLRGLSFDPAERYPSMEALVHELESTPIRRRRRKIASVALVSLVLLIAATVLLLRKSTPDAIPVCTQAGKRVAAVWNPERETRVAQAMMDSNLSYAKGQWRRVDGIVDGYVNSWQTMYTDACEATRVRGEQSEEMLDRRMLCLDERLRQVDAFASLLEEANVEVARRSVQVAMSLGDVQDCVARADLLGSTPLPKDPESVRRIGEARERLADVKVQIDAGQYKQAFANAEQLLATADAEKYAPLIAEAWFQLAMVRGHQGDYRASNAAFLEAVAFAEASGDDALRVRALSEAVYFAGFHGDTETGQNWARLAHSVLARMGGNERILARLLRNEGALQVYMNRLEDGYELQRKALELSTRLYGPEHYFVIEVLNDLASTGVALGKREQVLADQQRALETARAVLGQEHPKVADCLNNLGNWYASGGEFAKAGEYYEQAREIWATVHGPRHAHLAVAYSNLGQIALLQEDYDKALKLYEKALSIETEVMGENSRNLAITLSSIGIIQLARDQPRKAVASLQRAHQIFGDGDVIDAATTRFALARGLDMLGERENALTMARAARQVYAARGEQFIDELDEIDEWLEDMQ